MTASKASQAGQATIGFLPCVLQIKKIYNRVLYDRLYLELYLEVPQLHHLHPSVKEAKWRCNFFRQDYFCDVNKKTEYILHQIQLTFKAEVYSFCYELKKRIQIYINRHHGNGFRPFRVCLGTTVPVQHADDYLIVV